MANLQAKTEEQQEFVRSKLTDVASWVGIVNEDRVELDGWVDFDQMAEIVEYLRGDEYLIKVDEPDLLSKIEYVEVKRKVEDYSRLLDENRKLFNICERLKKENEMLKEKTKRLPRIATLNKRIHELKEQIKKYEMR